MGIVFRQSVKSSIVILSGAILGAFVIYLSQKLLPEQLFGFSRTLTNIAMISGQLLIFGMNSTLAVYIHKYDFTDPRRKALIAISLIIPLALLLLASVLFLALHNTVIHLYQPQDIPYFQKYYGWIPVYTGLIIYQVLLEQYLNSQMKVALPIFLREVLLRCFNIILIVLYGLGLINFHSFIGGNVLVYLIPVLLMFLLSMRSEGFGLSLDLKAFGQDEKKEMIHFTWYHILLSVSLLLMGSIDVIMLGALSKKGVSSVAGYTIAIFIISVLQIPYKAMTSATFPVMTQAYKAGDMDKVKDVFMRSGMNIFTASLCMCLLIGCNLHNFVAMLQHGYESVATLVLIMMVGKLADMATGLNNEMLSISSYYKISFYLSLFLVASMIILNYIFIPRYGVYGAAWATSIAYLIFNLGKLYFVWSKLRLIPFNSNVYRLLAVTVLALAPGYFLPHFANPFLDIFVRSAVIMAVFIIFLIWWNVSPDVNFYLQNIKKSKRLF
ncbi:MATE family efflux transporter [Chitinophagaceae bacterium MMS25-I14]